MFKRTLEASLKKYASYYPVVGLTGPRQSGKTTLVKQVFSHLPYVLLENFDVRLRAQQDPQSFLKFYEGTGAIFDEIQYVPELLSYLQGIVDASQEKGRFVITGSQNFSLIAHITQSLAGRIGLLTLLPLSYAELNHAGLMQKDEVYKVLFEGGYPRLYEAEIPPVNFFPSYLHTYVERDVPSLLNIENLGLFKNFLKLCAARIGQLVNLTSLAQDAGISHTTARSWLTVLEASYIVFLLQPFHKNFNKRIIKTPKLYFYDTGLAASLLELEQSIQVQTHYLKGALYENLVVLECMKARIHRGLPAPLYFWRDQTGHEVDLVAEWGGSLKTFEIKSSMTFNPSFLNNSFYFKELNVDQPVDQFLVYEGGKGLFKNTELITLADIEKKVV